ncbi:MAG: ketopantoate reductase family protein [Planctomycetes bacterium]|nr:ketopantoate reductase family protein [Planctomycetota bacterium]
MRILVYGCGAIGSVFGGMLAQAGNEVFAVGWPPHMDAIRRRGLRITGIWGDRLVESLQPVSSLEAGGFDAILISTKAYETEAAARAVAPFAGPQTIVVSLQNGLGNLEAIEHQLGTARAVGGRVIFGAAIQRPGAVEVTVYGGEVLLGSRNPGSQESIERLAAEFTRAGIPTRFVEDIDAPIWGKVLYNAALNPLGALLEVPYGVLGEHGSTRALMEEIIVEAFGVAAACGVHLPWEDPGAYVEHFWRDLLPPTADHRSSMLQDLEGGRRTEIDALNGAVVRLGAKRAAPAPVNAVMANLIRAAEAVRGIAVPGRP